MKKVEMLSFENFINESLEDASFQAALKLLGAKPVTEYVVLDMKLPKRYSEYVFCYFLESKTYAIFEKENKSVGTDISIKSHVADKNHTYIDPLMTTKSSQLIYNVINLGFLEDAGLSKEAATWLSETMMTSDKSWENIIKDLLTNGPLTDNDYKILKVDKETYSARRLGKKFGI